MYRSQTCPKCRKDCNHSEINRIYIDFACDEDLACAQVSKECINLTVNSDAEETIKMLLEHIENGPEKTKTVEECEFCKEFQEAYNDTLTEKDLLAQQLEHVEREKNDFMANNQDAMAVIAQLELDAKTDAHVIQEMEERMEALEKLITATKSENRSKQSMIDDLEAHVEHVHSISEEMRAKLQHLNDKMKEMTVAHQDEINLVYDGLQNIIHGNAQRRLIRQYRNQSVENVGLPIEGNTLNQCKAIVPYCGDIDSWNYIVIPILKNSSQR